VTGCSRCGQENPERALFCNACGAPLAGESERREERKVVTCLFCDLVGFTARAETLDPEDVRGLLAPYHAGVRSELERHDGTVEKFIGDAVMAVFGAPVAHEDDPERAVRAALAIRQFAQEEGLELRLGIATGEALVTLGARPETGEGMAAGDVVNTAARLQAAAPVNGILVGATTYRATRHAIEYREAPPVEAKGKTDPLPVWEALEARARFGREVLDHVPRELVGRDRELDTLRDALARARDELSPQLVTIVGVPGIGKSRLVLELSRIADADPELITWRQGRCLAYGDGVTFWALAEIVKAQAGILEADPADAAAEKLRGAVEDVLREPSDARWIEARLRPLAGLGDETELAGDRRGEAFAAWRRFIEALAEQRTLVMVFEDLHWADDGLLDFVDELAEWASAVPLVVVCTARPELLTRRPSWGGGKLNATTLALAPLSEEQTALLIAQVLEQPLLPAEVQQKLLERAGGNPLYAEQFAQLYLEQRSADELPLPATLHGIIAARLDLLSGEEKRLLQDAAVVGKIFWAGPLETIGAVERQAAEQLLHALERKDFVQRATRASLAEHTEYSFRHLLIRDVAYGQIPRAERAEKHRLAAEWIESLARAEDHAEMLAHHYQSALEYARAAGQETVGLVERARVALAAAGDRASALNAFAAAIRFYTEALDLIPADEGDPNLAEIHDAVRCDLLLSLGDAQMRAGNGPIAREIFLQAGDIARRLRMAEHLARAALGYGGRLVWSRAGADERVIRLLEEALEALGPRDSALRAMVLARLAGALRDQTSREPRASISRESVEMARRVRDRNTLGYALDGRFAAVWWPENAEERLGIADEIVRVAEEAGDAERAGEGHLRRLYALFELGEMEAARAELQSAATLAKELQQPAQMWDVTVGQAGIALLEGRFPEAEHLILEAFELGRQAQGMDAVAAMRLQLFMLRREQGRLAEQAETVASSINEYPTRAVFRCMLAHLCCELGRESEARAAFEDLAVNDFADLAGDEEWLYGLSLLADVPAFLRDARRAATLYELLLPHSGLNAVTAPIVGTGAVARTLGVLAATITRWADAGRHFESALAMNTEMGARPWVAHTYRNYASMLVARDGRGDRAKAQQHVSQAVAGYDGLGMEWHVARASGDVPERHDRVGRA